MIMRLGFNDFIFFAALISQNQLPKEDSIWDKGDIAKRYPLMSVRHRYRDLEDSPNSHWGWLICWWLGHLRSCLYTASGEQSTMPIIHRNGRSMTQAFVDNVSWSSWWLLACLSTDKHDKISLRIWRNYLSWAAYGDISICGNCWYWEGGDDDKHRLQ